MDRLLSFLLFAVFFYLMMRFFGQAYVFYISLTPGFIPRLSSLIHRTAS